MNWILTLEPQKKYIEIARSGEFELGRNLELFEELPMLSYWQKGIGLLIDNTLLKFVNFNYRQAHLTRGIHISFIQYNNPGKIAWVAGSLINFGIGRQIQELITMEGVGNLQIFMNRAEAEDWLLS